MIWETPNLIQSYNQLFYVFYSDHSSQRSTNSLQLFDTRNHRLQVCWRHRIFATK